MSLTLKEVEHIAELARLELTSEEKERFRVQLSAILEYAARLQTLDTGETLPTSGVAQTEGVLREDAIVPGLRTDQVLANTRETDADQFRVPPILD
jgi:aspartyl-tRNA(Asn)/glutamyl-tRNA(Gln) amidotransferase subunit C